MEDEKGAYFVSGQVTRTAKAPSALERKMAVARLEEEERTC
jgi:hypothetical protein